MPKKIIRLRQVFQTGEEGWVEYPTSLSAEQGISFKKVRGWPDTWVIRKRGEFVYVQGEDAHGLIESQLEMRGLQPRYTQWSVINFNAWLKGKQWPNAAKWKGRE
jgi:hypothetical protein